MTLVVRTIGDPRCAGGPCTGAPLRQDVADRCDADHGSHRLGLGGASALSRALLFGASELIALAGGDRRLRRDLSCRCSGRRARSEFVERWEQTVMCSDSCSDSVRARPDQIACGTAGRRLTRVMATLLYDGIKRPSRDVRERGGDPRRRRFASYLPGRRALASIRLTRYDRIRVRMRPRITGVSSAPAATGGPLPVFRRVLVDPGLR